eukprot:8940538-Lingulodinium_polyedra.AAC.1
MRNLVERRGEPGVLLPSECRMYETRAVESVFRRKRQVAKDPFLFAPSRGCRVTRQVPGCFVCAQAPSPRRALVPYAGEFVLYCVVAIPRSFPQVEFPTRVSTHDGVFAVGCVAPPGQGKVGGSLRWLLVPQERRRGRSGVMGCRARVSAVVGKDAGVPTRVPPRSLKPSLLVRLSKVAAMPPGVLIYPSGCRSFWSEFPLASLSVCWEELGPRPTKLRTHWRICTVIAGSRAVYGSQAGPARVQC